MYDVTAIGNALVDKEYLLTDAQLAQTKLTKGSMALASLDEQNQLLQALQQANLTPAKVTGGGAAANAMYAFACLGGKSFYACRVGDDEAGHFYLTDLNQAGVATAATSIAKGGVTGSCLIAITPDGERSMQTYLGTSSEISKDNINFEALVDSEWLYLEGYLAMSTALRPSLNLLRQQAGLHNTKIAVSFAVPAVVTLAKDGLLEMLGDGVAVIFCNAEEARLFTGKKQIKATARALTEYCELAVVTNGSEETVICERQRNGKLNIISVPTPVVADVIGTNGAGDNYSGAFLYGLSQQYTLSECGRLASAVASKVVRQFGPRLTPIQYQDIAKRVLMV